MIAAGSLFTSCVTNTEPQGIKDMREAKADYIASLSKLKQAEIEKVKAEAAVEQANADYRQAEVEYQQIQNQIAQCKADEQKAKFEVELKKQEAQLVKAEKSLAEAEFALQQELNRIAVLSKSLSPGECDVIDAYTKAYGVYIEAKEKVREAEHEIYKMDSLKVVKLNELQDAISSDSVAIAAFKEKIAEFQDKLSNLPDSGNTADEISAFYKDYIKQLEDLNYERANIDKEYNTYLATELGKPITGFATELGSWVAQNAALPAPFNMHYKAALPDNEAVAKVFAECVNSGAASVDSTLFVDKDNEYLYANFKTSIEAWKGVAFVDSIVDAISRKYIVDTTDFDKFADTTGLSAAVAKAQAEYAAVADSLTGGFDKYFEKKKAADSTVVEGAAKTAYNDLYKKFWGVDTAYANTNTIEPKEFAEIFADTAKHVVIDFEFKTGFYTAEDSTFAESQAELAKNGELDILHSQLSTIYFDGDFAFEETLLYKLFAKEQYLEKAEYTGGSATKDEALAALAEISKGFKDAFSKALDVQVENSNAFFGFVQELIGEDFLNTLFAKIDAGLSKYAEYVDVPVTKPMDFIAKAVASKVVTSKQLFTLWFEFKLRNEVGDKYRQVYMALQIADAVAGEQFRQLLSDFIAAMIEKADLESKIELVSSDHPFANIAYAAALQGVPASRVTPVAFIYIMPEIASYLINDFGGKIAELQGKYFAEWSAKRDAYDAAIAKVQAKIGALDAMAGVLKAYCEDSAIKGLLTKEFTAKNIIGKFEYWLAVYEEKLAADKIALEKFLAGPEVYEQYAAQKLADKLAEAKEALVAAEAKLKAAKAAYDQVLANHESVDTPTE